jgi:iron-sulfur cluster assembly accessory protein
MTIVADLRLTERAAARINEIATAEHAESILRLTVDGGGCSGFQYRFDLADHAHPDDIVIEVAGARLVVDPVSLPYLLGSEVDYVDELIGAQFRVTNPNATASCGCGTSFSI